MNTENTNQALSEIEDELNKINEADTIEASTNSCHVNSHKMNVAFGSVC